MFLHQCRTKTFYILIIHGFMVALLMDLKFFASSFGLDYIKLLVLNGLYYLVDFLFLEYIISYINVIAKISLYIYWGNIFPNLWHGICVAKTFLPSCNWRNLILWRILDVRCHTNDSWHIPNYFGRSCCSLQFPNFDVLYHYLLYVHTYSYIRNIYLFHHLYILRCGWCRFRYYKWWYFPKLNGFQIVQGYNNDVGIFRVYSAFPLNSFWPEMNSCGQRIT